jgi:guanylate kinase
MTDHTRESSAPRNPYAGAYPGNLFMVVAPSGAGKSTLVNALLARDEAIRL